jgi:uncharacterized DUF497 family protein
MALIFEWDRHKARTNLLKHRVSFREAASVFSDPYSITIVDTVHSSYEERRILIGATAAFASWSSSIWNEAIESASSAPARRHEQNRSIMRDMNDDTADPMLDEYDFSGGVRGRYAGRFSADSTLVVLDSDVAAAFPDAESVNEALREFLHQGTTSKRKE